MTMELQLVASGLAFPEGPVYLPDGSILLVEIARKTLSRVSPGGEITVVAETGGGPNGIAIGPDGKAYVCNNGGIDFHRDGELLFAGHKPQDYVTGSIQRVDIRNGSVETLYTHCEGVQLNGPNDIVFDALGGFWFTDLGKSEEGWRDQGAVYYAKADGSHIKRWRTSIPTPNGIGLSPDQSVLYVADSLCGRLWAIDLEEPGVARDPEDPWMAGRVICTLPGFQMLDSLAVEADGRVAVGTVVNGGITVFSPDGSTEFHAVPDRLVTNIVFGGADMQDAWITATSTGRLYRCRWPRPGLRLNYNL